MRTALGLLVSLCMMGTFMASSAAAQNGGFEGGLRTGYAVALGETSDNNDLDDLVSGVIPIWVDAGYRMDESLFFGGYFQYGFGFVGNGPDDGCDASGVDCSTSSMRLGAQIHYHVSPDSSADVWFGYGLGYEWLNFSVDAPSAEFSATASGFEFANLQLGIDFRASENFYIGPVLSFSLGQYSSQDYDDCSGTAAVLCSVDGDIDDTSLHEWLFLGIRGGFTGFAK